MPIRTRRHVNKHQDSQPAENQELIAVVFAVSAAYYTHRKPMILALCGSVLSLFRQRKISMKRTCVALASLLLVASTARGEEEEPLYQQLCRAVIRLEHLEVLQQEGATNVVRRAVPDGTGFFVASSNELYLVSARHVVEKPHDLHARVECKNQKTKELEIIKLELPRDHWVFHPQAGDKDTHPVDVAVIKLQLIKDRSIKYFRYEPKGSAEESRNQLPDEDAQPPQPILVFGFPADIGFTLLEQRPMGRFGIVSMTTGKEFLKLENGKFAESRSCFLDAPMFPGNSGSPVMNQLSITDSKPRLLGLVMATNNSLSYGIMEPASRIRETIEDARSKQAAGRWSVIPKQKNAEPEDPPDKE